MKNSNNIRMCSGCKIAPANSYNSYCKKCACTKQKKYLKESNYLSNEIYKERIRAIIIKAKDCPCIDCKKKYPYYVMDLDHVRGEKKFELSRATSHRYAIKTILDEIAKCDVVCANCHRTRTFSSRYSVV